MKIWTWKFLPRTSLKFILLSPGLDHDKKKFEPLRMQWGDGPCNKTPGLYNGFSPGSLRASPGRGGRR